MSPMIAPPAENANDVRPVIALVGNPNVGKTTLFNRLSNLLAKTSNYPGTTVEIRSCRTDLASRAVQLVDLPGLYSLEANSPDEQVARDFLTGGSPNQNAADVIVVVIDTTRLQRGLIVARQVMELGQPVVLALNMTDCAEAAGVHIDAARLAERLGCSVVKISAKQGVGLQLLANQVANAIDGSQNNLPIVAESSSCSSCGGCSIADEYRQAAELARECCETRRESSAEFSRAADRLLTHRVLGPLVFAVIMFALFALIFWTAQYPMELLDNGISSFAGIVAALLPAGLLNSLITDGIISGAGSVLVFLPQICALFFVLTLLEDCGYLARAVVVIDPWTRRLGLPGQAFVPLLTAHACAIPAIMATRVIANRRDRLVAILVLPLMTCSARLPVYSMVAAMLFPANAVYAALLFAAAYALGLAAALLMSLILRATILPGNPSPLILELPPYRVSSVRLALRTAWDRGLAFVRDAGTVILFISIAIWALSNFPRLGDAELAAKVQASMQVTSAEQRMSGDSDEALEMLEARLAQEHSLLGRAGKAIQPVFEPLGFDWKTSVGVLASFAAREVVVSTLSILYETSEDNESFIKRMQSAKRADGTPVFNIPMSVSLMVFFVLAMQCLPTQAVVKRETGTWKWAIFQFAYMSLLAYGAAWFAKNLCELWLA